MSEISRRIKQEIESKDFHEELRKLYESIKLVSYFYLTLLFLLLLPYSVSLEYLNYFSTIALITTFFSYLIAISTQLLHFLADRPSNDTLKDFTYDNFWADCFPRCLAGLLEMYFYVIALMSDTGYLIAGYLVMKAVSVWKSENSRIEGRHTSVLRIAIALSLVLSLVVYFMSK